MKGPVVIGIDPGKTGAVVSMRPSGIQIRDMPVIKKAGSGKSLYPAGEMAALLLELINGDAAHVVIEMATAMPKQSSSTTWAQASGIYLWIGIAAALRLPLIEVRPQRWQKVVLAGYGVKDKADTAYVLGKLYPWVSTSLRGPKGGLKDGRSDALAIAEWGRQELKHNWRPLPADHVLY